MKNNRTNRKKVVRYFKAMNERYNLTGSLTIVPTYLYMRKKKSFYVLIGDVNNPKSELIKNLK